MADWIARLNDLSDVGNLDSALTKLMFAPIAAFFLQAANAVEAISRVIIDPVTAFASGAGDIVTSLFGGSSQIIDIGADATAADLNIFGILGFPVGLGIVFVGGFLIAQYLGQPDTSDLIPLTFTDIPFLGVEESNDE
ncbi:hypothetical protein ACOZ4L_02695 [Haloplanus ruber]|uniref:MscL family protein n=1 Tax=Haloplanus ruber TaxID=869892 RepID=A0ABD6D1U1_9EURY|nr:hypothetical protein [Haloplanus ruber]